MPKERRETYCTWRLNLRLFEGGGGAAAGAGDGGAGTGSAAGPEAGTLEDGTQMDRRFAERLEKQRKRHPDRFAGLATRQAGGEMTGGTGQNAQTLQGTGNAGDLTPGMEQGAGAEAQTEAQNANAQSAQNAQNAQKAQKTQKTPEQEFEELIKGKYAKQYQQRMQQSISDRFKNQADLQGQLDGLKPMLDALAKQRGIQAGDYETLSKNILDDDSLYEEEAEAAGMTVSAYKQFQRLQQQADEMRRQQEEAREQAMFRQHLQGLVQQGEELKKVYPNFDLMAELGNEQFRRMTSPEGGLTVAQAYHGLHYDELAPQIMSAGIQRARTQISQAIQANASRPVEGAVQGNAAAVNAQVDVRKMTPQQRKALLERARLHGEVINFG